MKAHATLLGVISNCALIVYAARIQQEPRIREAVPTTSAVYIEVAQDNEPRAYDDPLLVPVSSDACQGGASCWWQQR
jgi:hypothetical protein